MQIFNQYWYGPPQTKNAISHTKPARQIIYIANYIILASNLGGSKSSRSGEGEVEFPE
jgi:hypothetical protein